MIDGLAGQKRSQHVEGLVGTTSTGCRINAHHLHLVAVLATHAHAEGQPPRSLFGQRRYLTGHGDRMAQGQQVHTDVHADGGVQASQPRNLHEAVHAASVEERHVVGGEHVVEARISCSV